MTLRKFLAVLALWSLGGNPGLLSQESEEKSTINLHITDPFGKSLREYNLELRALDGRLIVRDGRQQLRGIPFGEYRLSVGAGCCRAERKLVVNIPQLWLQLAVPVRFGDSDWPGGYLEITGVLRPMSRQLGKLWVRARGLYLDFSREAQVDSSGRFSIRGLDMGSYVIEVFEGSRLLHSRVIEIDIKETVTEIAIDISNATQQ